MKLLDLTGREWNFDGCLGCELVSKTLKPFGGVIFKDENFMIAQDFELPIEGFVIISSIRHLEKLTELTDAERADLMFLINKCLTVLRENGVAEEYNIILEEKSGYHFHVWLMPRHRWMTKKFGKIMKNIKPIQEYALKNMRTEENFEKIKHTCEVLKTALNK